MLVEYVEKGLGLMQCVARYVQSEYMRDAQK